MTPGDRGPVQALDVYIKDINERMYHKPGHKHWCSDGHSPQILTNTLKVTKSAYYNLKKNNLRNKDLMSKQDLEKVVSSQCVFTRLPKNLSGGSSQNIWGVEASTTFLDRLRVVNVVHVTRETSDGYLMQIASGVNAALDQENTQFIGIQVKVPLVLTCI